MPESERELLLKQLEKTAETCTPELFDGLVKRFQQDVLAVVALAAGISAPTAVAREEKAAIFNAAAAKEKEQVCVTGYSSHKKDKYEDYVSPFGHRYRVRRGLPQSPFSY